jgi:cytochrome c-type biogenesis protein CcmH/NrfG
VKRRRNAASAYCARNWHFLARALNANQRPADAVEAFYHATKLDEADALSWELAGRTLIDLDRTDEALRAFTNSARIDAEGAARWIAIGAIERVRVARFS